MPLDSHSTALLSQLAALGLPPLHEMTPAQARKLGGALPRAVDIPMHKISDLNLERDGGRFPARLLDPTPAPDGLIVYYHGGGWVLGSIDQFEPMGRELARRSNCSVLLVDYRLAPEYPFPTAVDDAWHALQWADTYCANREHKQLPLIVAGDSAGANLAAVMALRARERQGPALAMQVLVYPATDADFTRPSYLEPENQLLLSADSMRWFWNHYLPNPVDRQQPDATPLNAETLAGVPPAVVVTAEFDPLRDEGELYAHRLAAAGVHVEFWRKTGQMHGFFSMYPTLPASAEAIGEVARAVRRRIVA